MQNLFFHIRRLFRLDSIKLKGMDKGDSFVFTLNYIGNKENLEYIKNFYFSKILNQENSTTFWVWSLNKKLRELISSQSHIFVEIDCALNFLLPKGGFLTFPWVVQKVSLKTKMYHERIQKIEQTFARKVRQNNYTFRISNDERCVLKFYEEFYVPYMQHRYKELAYLRSLVEFYKAVRRGFLLQVFDEDKWVSGAVCRIRGKEITTLAFGLLPEYSYHLRRGALSAVYYFIFKWAQENSIRVVNLLRSRPNTQDGVYEHKRRWGAKPQKDAWPPTSLWMFIPKNLEIPSVLKKQLVWQEGRFTELKELLNG